MSVTGTFTCTGSDSADFTVGSFYELTLTEQTTTSIVTVSEIPLVAVSEAQPTVTGPAPEPPTPDVEPTVSEAQPPADTLTTTDTPAS